MNYSEYSVKPKAVLMHNPRKNNGIKNLTISQLNFNNFLALPTTNVLFEEFDKVQTAISSQGVEVLELLDFLPTSDHKAVSDNPNSIFTRDPVITIPWNNRLLIKSNMKIEGRKKEPELAVKALQKIISDTIVVSIDEGVVEGGDIIPIVHLRHKILLLGYGKRTEIASAIVLMNALDEKTVDVIFCLKNESLLHLDTALSIISDKWLLLAEKTFNEGYILDRKLMFEKLNPKEMARQLGIKKIYVSKNEALIKELCNLLPIGNTKFIGCNISEETREKINKQTDATIISIPSVEITKGAGGVHCLTRPIY